MANNNIIFDAALAGATGGAASRWLTKQVNTDYDAIAASLVVFATAVDTEIGTDPTLSQQDANLMQAICEQVFAGRWPPTASTLDLLTMQNIALSIKAMWTRLKGENLPVSGGSLLANLGTVWYADADTTVPAGQRTGNIEAPFKTIAAAVAAATAGDTIVCVGNFTEDLSIGKALTISSIAETTRFGVTGTHETTAAVILKLTGANISGVFDLFASSTLRARDCGLDTLTGNSGEVDATDCIMTETTSGNVQLTRCRLDGAVTVAGAGAQVWKDSEIIGIATVTDLTATGCSWVSNLIGSGAGILTDCSINGNVSGFLELTMNDVTVVGTTAADVIHQAVDCEFTGTVTTNKMEFSRDSTYAAVALAAANNNVFLDSKYSAMSGIAGSTVDMDAYSASWAAVTGGLVRSLVSPRASVAVVVPVLAANAIGTATAVLTGTILAGLTTASQVVGSEPTAGVAGGGFLGSTRISATNTALFTFHGPTTGGSQNFVVTQI